MDLVLRQFVLQIGFSDDQPLPHNEAARSRLMNSRRCASAKRNGADGHLKRFGQRQDRPAFTFGCREQNDELHIGKLHDGLLQLTMASAITADSPPWNSQATGRTGQGQQRFLSRGSRAQL